LEHIVSKKQFILLKNTFIKCIKLWYFKRRTTLSSNCRFIVKNLFSSNRFTSVLS